MRRAGRYPRSWLLILMGSVIPLTLIMGIQFHIEQRFTAAIVVAALLVFASMELWIHASAPAIGDEWWQDDHCSGGRGY
ncbi:MAG: hypothetical protein K8J31_15240 [Anaerolineae bacterium]|nr:hypothetical protein [Anaerolineae bacterium]